MPTQKFKPEEGEQGKWRSILTFISPAAEASDKPINRRTEPIIASFTGLITAGAVLASVAASASSPKPPRRRLRRTDPATRALLSPMLPHFNLFPFVSLVAANRLSLMSPDELIFDWCVWRKLCGNSRSIDYVLPIVSTFILLFYSKMGGGV